MYKSFVINCLFACSILLNVQAEEKEEIDLQSTASSNTQLWEKSKMLDRSPLDAPAQIPKYEDVTPATPSNDRLQEKNKIASWLAKAADSEKSRNKRTPGRGGHARPRAHKINYPQPKNSSKDEESQKSETIDNTALIAQSNKTEDSQQNLSPKEEELPKTKNQKNDDAGNFTTRESNKTDDSQQDISPKGDNSQKSETETVVNEETNPTVPADDETATIKGVLKPNSTLERGKSWTSKSENNTLTMQEDGNLVLRDKIGRTLWHTDTTRNGWKATFLPDGNFVVTSAYGDTVWSSKTEGHPNSKLIVQDDNNLVIYDGDRPIWASRTEKCSKPKWKFAPNLGPVEVNLTSSNELFPPFGLERGQRWEFHTGTLNMQEDGNLVLRNSNNETIWDSNTQGRGARAVFQEDGNFVIYSDSWRPVWSSNTAKTYNAKLVPQDDGNLFLSVRKTLIWATFTDRVFNSENGVDVLATQPKEIKGTSVLKRGESWSSETADLTMQLDGNLVVYDEFGNPRWKSDTVKKGWRAVFHEDGNFAVYSKRWISVWSSGTGGHPNATLSIQNDGNVVIYDVCNSIWSTGTNH